MDRDDADETLAALDDDGTSPEPPRRLVVDAAGSGRRLDRVLAELLPEVSRSRIQRWIADGAVRVNGAVRRPRDAVIEGDVVDIEPPAAPEAVAFRGEPITLDIVHEDDAVIVVDKAPGMVVHPAAGHWAGTLLNGLLAHDAGLAGVPRAGIVHRLDADTSGLMVVARTLAAQTHLVRQLAARSVTREYWAIAYGAAPAAGSVEAPIGRDPRNPLRFKVSHSASAREARTHWRCVDIVGLGALRISWIACRLDTGRTHQIRVHLESIGHPLVGDPVYKRGRPSLRPDDPVLAPLAAFRRQALHACRLSFNHPSTNEPVGWFRAPPDDLRGLMLELGFGPADRAREAFS